MTIDELLETPYWVIDILPKQVPSHGPGQYFAVEEYLLQEPQLSAIKQRHINVVLKLNCYRDISIDEETETNPSPTRIAREMRERYVCLMVDGAMIVSEPDDATMTVFNPNEKLLELLEALASSEGLFVWQPPN
ncbi:MAG: hypothetical protein II128_00165 [Atopobiaceae bacterium]|nr:hypothetical protein [Atopobiaceae bacterium]